MSKTTDTILQQDKINTVISAQIMVPVVGFPATRTKLLDVLHQFTGKPVTYKGEIVGSIRSVRVGEGASARAELRLTSPIDIKGLGLNASRELTTVS